MLLTQDIHLNLSILNKVHILTVDNDRDSGALYTTLFEHYGMVVMTTGSIEEALELLNRFVPDVLVCEARFFGESIDPLIHKVRSIAQNRCKVIPIFVTSTFPVVNLAEHLRIKVEAYQIKPLDVAQFVTEVWSLVLMSKITQPFRADDWLARLNLGEKFFTDVEV
ncbi:MAG: response regulator [Oscillatoriales cyanobacterium C42_A2020_001]|nr:response regulator [Leptolyngbyaceae cyanobacterium C42_A2020_001]